MQSIRLVVFVVVGMLSSQVRAAEPPLEYKLYATTDGRFKVLFPGPVRTETTEVKTPSGVRKLTLETVRVSDSLLFMVTYIDVPDSVAKAPIGPRLDKIRDGNVGKDGKLVSEKSLELGEEKYPVRELLIEKPNTTIRVRVVPAGNRLYQVMVQGPREILSSKDCDRFYESFEVTK